MQTKVLTRNVVIVRRLDRVSEPDPVSGVQVQTQVNQENVEQVARDAGTRWGMRLVAQYDSRQQQRGNWPGTLEEARHIVDTAVGRKLPHDDRELLALLVERGARRAWHSQPR